MIGTIKKILSKGYGFISAPDGTDYFFHSESYMGDWEKLKSLSPPITLQGPEVQFTEFDHKRGARAIKVMLIE